MLRSLILSLTFLSLLFFVTPTFATNTCNYCGAGTTEVGGQCQVTSSGGTTRTIPKTAGCPAGKNPSPSLADPNCSCVAAAAAAAGATDVSQEPIQGPEVPAGVDTTATAVTTTAIGNIQTCPAGAAGDTLASNLDDFNKCPVETNCYSATGGRAGALYTCHKFSATYTQSTCNADLPVDQIPACTSGTLRTAALSCDKGGKKGFICNNTTDERFCTDEQSNIVCESLSPAAAVDCPNPPDPNNPKCTTGGGLTCPNGQEGIYTAIGCIPTKPKAFVDGVLRFVIFASGGIAILLMILGAIQMITSEGNPENLKNAQERFYHAIIGLLMIVFSVLLMQVIGYDILNLPGFGR